MDDNLLEPPHRIDYAAIKKRLEEEVERTFAGMTEEQRTLVNTMRNNGIKEIKKLTSEVAKLKQENMSLKGFGPGITADAQAKTFDSLTNAKVERVFKQFEERLGTVLTKPKFRTSHDTDRVITRLERWAPYSFLACLSLTMIATYLDFGSLYTMKAELDRWDLANGTIRPNGMGQLFFAMTGVVQLIGLVFCIVWISHGFA